MTTFETLIEELGQILEIPLKAEKETVCKISVGGAIDVQIEQRDGVISIASFLAELPPGAFREEALIQALKFNHDEQNKEVFSYISKKQTLALEVTLPESVSAGELSTSLKRLIETGTLWKDAIDLGNLTAVTKQASSGLISPIHLQP